MPIGVSSPNSDLKNLAAQAQNDAARLPDLLVSARRIANTVMMGWHGRRQYGPGENFWQFRPYFPGEAVAQIDWRRSARDEHTYIRDREWEAAQTVWLWPDRSASMDYQSRYAPHSKADHALLLSLILGEIFSRCHERIAIPAILAPTSSKNGAERMAESLFHDQKKQAFPDFSLLSPSSQCVIISDFLDAPDQIEAQFALLQKQSVHVHLIEVMDPAEADFPYSGRVEFIDPENGARLLSGRAQTLKADYQKLYQARRETLRDFCRRHGWSYLLAPSDAPSSHALLGLVKTITAPHGYRQEG